MENNDLNQNNSQPMAESSVPTAVGAPIESKRKTNKVAILLGVLAVIFAGIAVFFGVKYFEISQTGNSQDGNTANAEESTKQEEKVEADATTMAGDYEEVKELMNTLTSDIESVYDIENGKGLTYKPSDFNTHIPMKLNLEKTIRNTNSKDSNVAALQAKLESNGFNSIGVLPHLGSAGPTIYGYLDTSRNITCGVYGGGDYHNPNDPNDGYDYAVLECAKTDWLWLTNEDETLAHEIENSYYEKKGEYPTLLDVSERTIKDSEYDPYQVMEVSFSSAKGLLY